MAKKTKVKDYDQFQLRLPPGMRDRIKAKAERAGMSMNDAIVWVLDREFPADVTLEEKLYELANMVSMLKDSKDTPAGVDYLIQEVEETVRNLGSGVDPKFAAMVDERLQYWQEREMDNWRERNESPFHEEPPYLGDDPFNIPDDIPYENKKD
ncbi:UNVERIFIED_ORG: FAD/FMN-containing dehydrogenase [Agrobacterium larrymoorei]|nr:FAD/FMN-containing dehydrogenase [Agrobacterium larrymoorei]